MKRFNIELKEILNDVENIDINRFPVKGVFVPLRLMTKNLPACCFYLVNSELNNNENNNNNIINNNNNNIFFK